MTLDISPEKKRLLHAIAYHQQRYARAQRTLEQLRTELAAFQSLYDTKVNRLYRHLSALERLLFKYRNIAEHVDDTFTLEDAEQVFENTMKDKRARMDEEYHKQHATKMPVDAPERKKKVLKQLYRNLARLFHPDKTGGDEQMMKKINHAYMAGDVEMLRDLAAVCALKQWDDSLAGLQKRLTDLTRLTEKTKTEIRLIRASSMFVLRKNMLKENPDGTFSRLDSLAHQLRKEIRKKEDELQEYRENLQQTHETLL